MKESQRQQKYSKMLQKDLGDIFQKDARSIFGKAFITVTNVKVSPDLGVARVYLSFMLVDNKKAMLESVNEHKKEIRKILGNRIGKQVRVIPELAFILDDSAEYASKMDALISSLDIPPADESKKDSEEEEN
jgi:ribosome-binding factor A